MARNYEDMARNYIEAMEEIAAMNAVRRRWEMEYLAERRGPIWINLALGFVLVGVGLWGLFKANAIAEDLMNFVIVWASL